MSAERSLLVFAISLGAMYWNELTFYAMALDGPFAQLARLELARRRRLS